MTTRPIRLRVTRTPATPTEGDMLRLLARAEDRLTHRAQDERDIELLRDLREFMTFDSKGLSHA